jgi:hypothetical protein
VGFRLSIVPELEGSDVGNQQGALCEKKGGGKTFAYPLQVEQGLGPSYSLNNSKSPLQSEHDDLPCWDAAG